MSTGNHSLKYYLYKHLFDFLKWVEIVSEYYCLWLVFTYDNFIVHWILMST